MTLVKSKKVISLKGGGSVPAGLISDVDTLKNNEYKITYYEIISGTSGSITVPTGATINANEFGDSGNAVLSKINGSNKPTFESPKTSGGVVVTASLNSTTGAWLASGTYTDSNVALIYSIKIKAIDYQNLNYDRIIDEDIDTSILPGVKGGTGAVNLGKTITVGGNFSTVGAFTLALNVTANTGVTLPTTGTLSTLAGTETLTNKTIGSGSSYAGGSISTSFTDAKIKGTTGSSANRLVLTDAATDTIKQTSQAFLSDGSTTTFQLNGTTGGSGQIVATTELYISVNGVGSSIIFRPASTEKFRMTSTGLRVNGSGNPTQALQVSGNIYMDGATNTLMYRSGTNQRCGTATLVTGTVTVSNTTVASTTEIRLTRKTLGTSPGYLSYSKINSTSFTITSSDPGDDGVILYELIEIV